MISLDISPQDRQQLLQACRIVGMTLEEFIISSAIENARQFQTDDNNISDDDYQSTAWLVGQNLFGCYQGSAELSQKAKSIIGQAIKEKYGKCTS